MYIRSRDFPTQSNGPARGPQRAGSNPSQSNNSINSQALQSTSTSTSTPSRPERTTQASSAPTSTPALQAAAATATSTSTLLDLPAIAKPSDFAAQTAPVVGNGVIIPNAKGISSGAIIGITMASLVALVLLLTFLDIILLSSRVQSLFRRTSFGRNPKDPPTFDALTNTITRKAVPVTESMYYKPELKHSRSLSLDSSGYSSRYSRSTWGCSEEKKDSDEFTLLGDERMMRKSMDFSVYEMVFDDDDELTEEKRKSYHGGIRIGMGVQKRYTGLSFAWQNIYEDPERAQPEPERKRKRIAGITWILADPLERWRKGLHPLTGRRGAEFTRIGYYG